MFSGLTNQVSSWMGAAKGEPQDEEVPTPTKEATGEAAAAVEAEKLSPTKAGSKLDLITNVKSQMTGWLGSGIPIPGLRKNEVPSAETAEPAPVEPAEEPRPEGKDDDDNSRYNSATGGADSRPASTGGTPTEEQPGGVGNVTTKAVAGAKSLGNFLYSAVNKAGAKVSEASAKIKKTVEENSILGEFNREQDAFIKGQEGRGGGAAAVPWVGAPNEAALKEECLSLSTDRRNFVRAPPAGVEFDFDYDKMYPVAVAIMGEDPNLEKMRFDLVPKVITEENFWRNYFYRMSLICQANEADAQARQPGADSQVLTCEGQQDPGLPVTLDSFRQILRSKINVPPGRSTSFTDIFLRFYGTNTTIPTSYRIRDVNGLLSNPNFDFKKPTVIYTHGFVELTTDMSVLTVVKAYIQHGGYNIVVLDWANLGFGNYVFVSLDASFIGKEAGKALLRLVKGGVDLQGLHLIGHSLGAHILGTAARYMASKGYTVPRLTGLDPAYPGFYPGILGVGMSSTDASHVEAIHTDGGGFGAPNRVASADYWPGGGSSQPGCPPATVPLTVENFCSHWRSWAFWAESVTGGEFLAKQCSDYDSFLRGLCRDQPLVHMGLKASPESQGNFYLRTAAKSPYALGERGAE